MHAIMTAEPSWDGALLAAGQQFMHRIVIPIIINYHSMLDFSVVTDE